MASNKPEFEFPVPASGVRRDVQAMLRTPEMAANGKNVIYYDGVIRPRPALTNELFGTTDAPAWMQVYNDGDVAGWHMMAFVEYGYNTGVIIASWMNAGETAQKFMVSTDSGVSWQDWGTHPHASVGGDTEPVIRWMQVFGGYYLFCYASYHTIADPEAHTPDEWLHRINMNNFWNPAAVQSFGPMEFNAKNTDDAASVDTWETAFKVRTTQVKYNVDSGALVFSDMRTDETGYPCVWYLRDALSTVTINDVKDAGGMYSYTLSTPQFTNPRHVNETWLAYGENTSTYQFPSSVIKGRILARNLSWNSSTSLYDYGTYISAMTIYDSEVGINLMSEPSILAMSIKTCVEMSENGGTLWPVALTIDSKGVYHHDFVRVRFNSLAEAPVIFNLSIHSTYQNVNIKDLQWDGELVNGRMVFVFIGPTDVDTDPPETEVKRALTSDTDGLSWKKTGGSGGPEGVKLSHTRMFINILSLRHFIAFQFSVDLFEGVDKHRLTEVWLSPSSGGASVHGDVTTLTQMDMDDEDAVVIVGTTNALLRLDRTALAWNRITADHTETVDTEPSGVWTETGDVPPLTVSPERNEYASGTTIAGVYGTNPWVFRAFEAQGETMMLATNGQCRPICYHPSMTDGFARRMGEVPPNDPNDLPSFSAANFPYGYLRTGNLAPIARCMAVGANRVLLANLPGTSPYAIEVSGFNDPDRGWGLEQFSLLGDTPGEIVSLNEISALSIATYKTDAIYHAIAQTEFLGVAAPFRFELSKAGISGPCSPGAVLRNYDGRHIYLARDGGIYMYDGVAPIDGGRNIRRMIQGAIDLNYLGKCWGTVDYERKLVWFFYPTKDGLVNQGIVISTDQGYPWPVWEVALPAGWSFAAGGTVFFDDDITIDQVGRLGDYGDETLGSFSSGNQQILMGTQSNVWFSHKWEDDGDYSDDGDNIRIKMNTGWLSPGRMVNPPSLKSMWTADELYHLFSCPDPAMELKVRLAAQQIGGRSRVSAPRALSVNTTRRRTRHRVTGNQFALELSGGINRIFHWGGAVMPAAKRGKR